MYGLHNNIGRHGTTGVAARRPAIHKTYPRTFKLGDTN
jgi:hypothetical protein